MRKNVTAAVAAASHTVTVAIETARNAVLAEMDDLSAQRAELGEMLEKFDALLGQTSLANVEPRVTRPARKPVVRAVKRKYRRRKKAAAPGRAVPVRVDASSQGEQILALLSDKKARESKVIEAAFPTAKGSSVRSALHTLVKSGAVVAIGDAGRRRYRQGTSPRRSAAKPAASTKPSRAPRTAGAPKLRDLVLLAATGGPVSIGTIALFVDKRRPGTTQQTLYQTAKELRRRGLLVAIGQRGAYKYKVA